MEIPLFILILIGNLYVLLIKKAWFRWSERHAIEQNLDLSLPPISTGSNSTNNWVSRKKTGVPRSPNFNYICFIHAMSKLKLRVREDK